MSSNVNTDDKNKASPNQLVVGGYAVPYWAVVVVVLVVVGYVMWSQYPELFDNNVRPVRETVLTGGVINLNTEVPFDLQHLFNGGI